MINKDIYLKQLKVTKNKSYMYLSSFAPTIFFLSKQTSVYTAEKPASR